MASIHFEAAIDAKKLYQEFAKIEQQIRQVGDVTNREVSSMEKTFNRLGTAAGALFTLAAGKQFVSELVAVRGEFQQLGIALETILKDKTAADKLMADVVEFAAYTPFELTEVGQGVKKLLAFNVEAEDSLDILRRLGDISSGLSTDLGGMVAAYGKVKAKGKLQAEEMNLFLERGVPLVSALAEKYGVAESAIYDMASKSQIHFDDLHEVIVNLTDDGGMFANMMEKQAASLPGQISNLKDAVSQMLDEIGQSNEGILYGGIGVAKTLVENYDLVLIALKALIAGYGTYKTATITLTIIEQVKALGALAKATKAAKVAQEGLNLAQKGSPIWLAVAAVTALVVGMVALAKRTREANEETVDFGETVSDQESELNSLFEIIKRSAAGTEERAQAIRSLNQKYGEYLPNLVSEKDSLSDIAEFQKAANEALLDSIAIKAKQIDIQSATEARLLAEKEALKAFTDAVAKEQGEQVGKVATAAWKELYDQMSAYVVEGTTDEYLRFLATANPQLQNFAKNYGIAMDQATEYTLNALTAYRDYKKELSEIDTLFTETPTEEGSSSDFSTKEFIKQIKESKKAFEEWEQFKETSRADDLQGEYKHYLDLGDNYKEYLETRLKLYQGNHAAVMILTKELAAIEVKEIQAVKEAAEELQEQMDDLWGETLEDMEKAINDRLNESNEEETAALKDREKEIQAVLSNVGKIWKRYSIQKDQFEKDLETLRDAYQEGLISYEKYEEGKSLIAEKQAKAREDLFKNSMVAALNDLSYLLRDFDEELSESLNSMAILTDQFILLTESIASKDLLGSAMSIVGIIGSLINLFRDDAPESHAIQISKAQQAYDDLNKHMDITNRLLDDQYKLLDRLNGEEWLSGAVDTTRMLNDALAETVTQLYLAINEGKTIWDDDFVWTINWSVEDFQKYIDENLVGEEADKLQAIIDQYKALQEQLVDIGEEIRVNLTGTTSDAISDTLSQVFANGEASAEKFTQTFEDLMKQAVIESFKKQFITSQMQGFYDAFAIASEDGLDGSEVTNLQQIWEQITQNAQEGWEALQNNFDFLNESAAGAGEDPNSLSGSIRRELTEETGSLLAGYINSMRLDVREGVDIQRDMLGAMGNIEYNTYLTADRLGALSSMQSDLREIRTQLTA